MIHGARQGLMTGMRRLVAGAMARDLRAFVVPGQDVARARGLDLAAAGLHLAASPRHANLLLIIGDLPPGLRDAASVVYAQMPRPRAILALGSDAPAPLPGGAATGAVTQSGLEAGLRDLRRIIAQGAFATEAPEFDAPALGTRVEYTCPMHPEIISDEPGSCPICGMILVEREASADGHAGHGSGKPAPEMDHAAQSHVAHGAHAAHTTHAAHGTDAAEPTQFTCPMHSEVISDKPGSCPKCGMHLVPVGGENAQGHGSHGSHGDHHQHGGHTDHSAQGTDAAEPTQFTCPMHPEVISDAPGSCPKCGMHLVPVGGENAQGHGGHGSHGDHHQHGGHTDHSAHGTDAAEPTQFTCPMHSEVISDKPGSCPKCGMHLVPVGGEDKQDHGSHGSHGDHHQDGDHTDHSAHDTYAAEPTQFTCPMHSEVISDKPGSCPKCGMHLVPVGGENAQGHGSHGSHGDHHQHGGHTDHSAQGTDAAEPTRFTCPMHPEVISDKPGSCPKCGMHLVPVGGENAQGHGGHGSHGDNHQDGDHTDHSAQGTDAAEPTQFTCPMHPEVISDKPGSCPKCGMHLVPVGGENAQGHGSHGEHHQHGDHAGHADHASQGGNQGHAGHGGYMHEHAGHGSHAAPQAEGIEAGFMSMVDLTRDLPASPDGLKMEWITAPFGPFFPGLPGGLGLMLTLDGDSVAKAEAQSLVGSSLGGDLDAHDFAERLTSLTPLAPVAMRVLACRALAAAAGQDSVSTGAARHAAALERERIASHLNWLAGFASQIGLIWLERRAAALQEALRDAETDEIAASAGALRALSARLRSVPLLRAKLTRIGRTGQSDIATGPVARAAGTATDTRREDPAYDALGFAIVTQSAGDALARLHQRLDEIAQSLDLIARAGGIEIPDPDAIGTASGHGMAKIETPRGAASLHLTLKAGRVTEAQITTPFAAHAALIGRITAQRELADALTAIGSLDLDPWEITP